MSIEKQQISKFQLLDVLCVNLICSINQIITGDTKWQQEATVKALKI